MKWLLSSPSFQSPEGDSLFFYMPERNPKRHGSQVSVPRRGFVVFLLSPTIT